MVGNIELVKDVWFVGAMVKCIGRKEGGEVRTDIVKVSK